MISTVLQESRIKNQKASKIKSFIDFIAWQEAHKVVLFIYKVTVNFPKDEQFGLTNQIRRAIVSITSNLAKGFRCICTNSPTDCSGKQTYKWVN